MEHSAQDFMLLKVCELTLLFVFFPTWAQPSNIRFSLAFQIDIEYLLHACSMQFSSSVLCPSQSLPPFLGLGLLQSRYLPFRPVPHFALHSENADHGPHSPFTATSRLIQIIVKIL